MTDEEIETIVLEVVCAEARFEGAATTATPTVELWELGIDSMGAINVLFALEERFGVAFDDDLVTEETFRSVESLSSAVGSLLGTAA